MKKIALLIFLFPSILLKAQFNPNYDDNYYYQKNYWKNYYDSLRIVRENNGIYDMRGTGYSGFVRWLTEWKSYMPISGDFSQAIDIKREVYQHLKKESMLLNQTGGINANSAIVPAINWEEIGPNSFNHITKYYGGNWINPVTTGDFTDLYGGVGRFDRLFIHPTNTQILFACAGGDIDARGGGAFISTNGGTTWSNFGTDKLPNPKVKSMAIKPIGVSPDPDKEYFFIGFESGTIYRAIGNGDYSIEPIWVEMNVHTIPGGIYTYPGDPSTNPNVDPNLSLPYGFEYLNPVGEGYNFNLIFTYNDNGTNGEYGRLILANRFGLYYSDNYNENATVTGNSVVCDVSWARFLQFDNLFLPSNIQYKNATTCSHELAFTDIEVFNNGLQKWLVVNVLRKEIKLNDLTANCTDNNGFYKCLLLD